ncbi:MAG: hypothetical protein HC804_08710 [Anaerolineae bacterium]|nr:hypothetical protein [Anaerolineae bacterium]
MTLLGVTVVAAEAKAGEPLALTLYWQRGTAVVPMPAPTKGAPLAAFCASVCGRRGADCGAI